MNAHGARTGSSAPSRRSISLPVDAAVARAYGRVYAAVTATGRKARGARSLDLLIAATALAYGLPLYTRNPGDFRGVERLIDVVLIEPAPGRS